MEATQDLDLATTDLGPLAWVLDELRKSLESATSAMRRYVRDAGLARGQDMASVDAGQLRIARQHMHQAVGALEMVGLAAPAQMLRSMEAAVQKFVERPELCTEPASAKVERAGFALTEYLEAVLMGKSVSPVALFPQYKDVQELAGADRAHPADLWLIDWRWIEPQTPAATQAVVYDPAVRGRLDQAVLRIVKSADPQAARELVGTSLSLAATQVARQPKVFWKVAAGYFEAVSLSLLPPDIYVKRAASRILLQYASLAKGEQGVSDRLAQDLVFFCSQAVSPGAAKAPVLTAVREAYGLARHTPVDYSVSPFGRFDPVLLAQARKRIGAAKETWSMLSGGDASKLKSVGDQFKLVTDSLSKLHPPSALLAQALDNAIDAVIRSGRPPSAELAMEVATAVLYLEAAYHDLDPNDSQLAVRTARLAERLDTVRAGGQPEALETWMEELYRRVSDRQTMGSVVGELRGTLSELEKLLDQFFRNPQDKGPLRDAPNHLAQMRGVLSVLGLEQASHAVNRMRDAVEEIIVTEIDEERARAAGTFDKLGNNLGALGFLIDMLNYQPALAKKLFMYDEFTGELRPLMGRTGAAPREEQASDDVLSQEVMSVVSEAADSGMAELSEQLGTVSAHAVLAENREVARAAREAKAAVSGQDADATAVALSNLAAAVQAPAPAATPAPPAEADIEEDDLRDIFLEEAREVVQNGLAALQALAANPADIGELTTLRRAFHTLKGSSRMVGLTEFGEAGWSMEQVLNTWLADQKPASDDLRALAEEALHGFGRWVEDIAANNDAHWKAGLFRGPADTMRTEQRRVPFVFPQAGGAAAPVEAAAAAPEPVVEAAAPAEPAFDFPPQPTLVLDAAPAPAPATSPPAPAIEIEFPAVADADAPIDFDMPDGVSFDTTQVIRAEPAVPAEIPADELPAEFEFDLGAPAAATPAQPAPEIEGIDFGSLSAVAGTPEIVEAADLPPDIAKDFGFDQAVDHGPAVDDSFDFAVPAAPVAAAAPAEAAEEPGETAESSRDEQVKVIGTLRIGIPLYNVYLNEADEWSRRLVTEVGEWALELNQPVPDSTVGWAHALAGSSATVGFHTLSDVARGLESALEHAQMLAYGTPQHALAFTAAAEEIRRLLHQFAAGFLKEPDPQVLRALHDLRDMDIPLRTDRPEPEEPGESGFGSLDFAAAAAPAEPPPVAVPPPAVAPPPAVVPPPVVAVPPVRAPELAQPAALKPAVPVPVPAPARPAVRAVDLGGEDDDIDVADVIDPDLFPIFEEEAAELMPQLGGALRQWSAHPGNKAPRDEVLRALHTLKGSARLAGALRLGEMAHRLESEIEYLGSENVNPADIEELLHRYDAMQARFDGMRESGAAVDGSATPFAQPEAPVAPAAVAAPIVPAIQIAVPAAAEPAKPKTALAVPTTLAVTSARQAGNQAVRVRSNLLDRLVNQAGEVMITRSRLEEELRQLRGSLADLTGNLDRLRSQLREIEVQAESQMQSRMAQSKESAAGFDPLEFDRFTRVQELTRFMAESVNDVATVQRNIQRVVEATEDDLIAQARQTRELQRDLLRTRMVEFEGISDRLYRVVRLAAKETGKQVKLDIIGGSIEMDRGVLDRMTPAFEHLLRNCVAHGVEAPAVRTAAGKDASGAIVIGLHHEGNDVSVEFKDDGAGLNLSRIREKALQQGLITADQQLTDAEAANLIFLPGFTTASAVTELAGRGIGMDVVRSEVTALGGRIETTTEAGAGTTFKLVLPLTTAVTQVVMIRSGSLAIGVPANLIELVRRATIKDVQLAYNAGAYDFGGEMLPFFWSGALLQSSARSVEPQGKTTPVVIFRSAAQRVAVHVDEVLGNQEVVVKNLGPQLSRLPGLAGMTVLASGAVVLIYNPVALAQVYGEQARQLAADKAQPDVLEQTAAGIPEQPPVQAPPAIPLVLVVDDSITVRRVTQRLLQREGYRVALAADGLQALERLAEERPAVVLSDIEMPRMDGFDLARNIRGDARMGDLPIIMITSRIAEKHREHARELGVNHYLGKPYSEEELLSLVKHYCTTVHA